MARELIVKTWCDNTERHGSGVNIEAQTYVVAIDGGKPRQLDLCDVCTKELLVPLRELLDAHGQPLDAEPIAPASSSEKTGKLCPDCGKSYGTNKGLREHRKNVHDWTDPRPADHKCPHKGCDAAFVAPQGLSAHRMQAHGWRKADDD